MVLTRGHKDEKSPQPARECRRSNRPNLQEPEDEIIWESDEHQPSKPRRSSKEGSTSNINHHQKRCKSGSKVKEDSVEDSEKDVRTERANVQNDDIERESDTDGELFVQKKNAHSQNIPNDTRRSSRHGRPTPIAKKFTLDLDEISDGIEKSDDDNEKSDHENGLRRSLRKKGFKNSSSWLVGPKTLRGYPNIINSSEPEHDEPRAAQKSRRYNRAPSKNKAQQRRSKQFHQAREHSNRYILSRRSHRTDRTRGSTRYSEEFHEQHDDSEDDDDCKKEMKEDTEDLGSTPQTDVKSKKQTLRPRRRLARKVQYDEDSNSDTEHMYTGRYLSRRSLRSSITDRHQKEERMSESENSAKEEDAKEDKDEISENDSKKIRTNKGIREPVLLDIRDGRSPCALPTKRMRKPVTRLTYEVNTNRRRSKISSSTSSSSSESSDDDNAQGSPSQGRSRYSLRQNRKTLSMKAPFEDIPSHRHKHKNSLSYLHSPARKHMFSRKQKATHARDDTSSSSDEKAFEKRKAKSLNKSRNRCLPLNMKPEDLQMGAMRDRKVGSSLADIDPMSMDTSITFESIGGLKQHIKALKEMILFPIMYPEVFQKFGVNPPRGVLFYGAPGTGKTLVARALANECSHDERKIAFFMRKGADCLSKWVGESERQLRLLFDQAYQMRPSIIFFDEIDGLAPVRSSRQDQIHSSIVSTLLALLDGIDSRGEIVIIGATNRIDAIDPALRRPGRFDREFHFPLPSIEARKQILQINTKKWIPTPSAALMKFLSEQTVGYCGADLKSLCGEAALVALRNKYPQIYSSKQKLLLDVGSIEVKCKHFKHCLSKIVPAGHRAANAPGRKLDSVFEPLMRDSLEQSLTMLKNSFPQGFKKIVLNRVIHRPRLLLSGQRDQGQTTLLAPAILHALERIPTHRLDFPSLFSVAARAPEEACAQIFHEAKRNVPSILYVPLIDHLWNAASESVKSTFLYLLNDLGSSVPILVLATVEDEHSQMDPELCQMFNSYREEIFVMSNPSRKQREAFFYPIFYKKVLSPPMPIRKKCVVETLPLAPPPQPRQLKQEEIQKLEYVEEASLRELRIFLRQICAKLAKNKMFYIFTKPVDLEEVTDYLQIISRPMDLETMMSKIDLHQYECAQDFLIDVEQIVANALEYNPDRNPEDKIIRHRACTLRDTAYAYIKAEMDTDFEDKCRDIRNNRRKRKRTPATLPPHFMVISKPSDDSHSSPETTKAESSNKCEEGEENRSASLPTSNRKRKRRSNWSRGMVSSKKKRIDKDKAEEQVKQHRNHNEDADSTGRLEEGDLEEEKSETSRSKTTDSDAALLNGHLSTAEESSHCSGSSKLTSAIDSFYSQCISDSIVQEKPLVNGEVDSWDVAVTSSEQGGVVPQKSVTVDLDRLEEIYLSCLSATEDSSIEELHHLYSMLAALCTPYKTRADRNPLLSKMEREIKRFRKYRVESTE